MFWAIFLEAMSEKYGGRNVVKSGFLTVFLEDAQPQTPLQNVE